MKRRHEDDMFAGAIKGMAVSGLRMNNERAVLAAITMTPGSSGAEITRATGLGAQTVSRMLVDLEATGIIMRGSPRRAGRGQPAIPISINPEGAFCIGCEVGWRHIEILVQNVGGTVLGRHRRDYAYPDATTIVEEIGSLSKLMIGLIPEHLRTRLVGIGLAMPSGIDRNINLLDAPPEQALAWRGLDIAAEVGKATGLEVFLYNDGNAGCWGEVTAHPMPRPRNLGYILVSTYIGAGLVAEGRLWEGTNGRSANLGSMMVAGQDGRQEFVHLVASLSALNKKLAESQRPVPSGNPKDWNWADLEPVLTAWIDEAGRAIAKTIVNTTAVIELDTAVVDGVMPRPIVERLVDTVRQTLESMPALTSDWPKVEIGQLGSAAPAIGASWLPMYRRFFSREPADLNPAI